MDMIQKVEEVFQSAENGQVYKLVINDTERILIEKALEKTNGNQILASRILGLNRNTLRTKIKKLQIDKRKFRG